MALTRASSFMLTKVPVVAIDEQLTSVMCVAPMEKITKTRFYVIRERMEEILVLETGFVKSDNGKTHMLETVYYPNGCPSDDDCSYLTVWSFDSTKSSPSVINHSWDEKKSRLLPYYKGRAQGSETNKQ